MKKFLGTSLILLISSSLLFISMKSYSQAGKVDFKGRLLSAENQQPILGASIQCNHRQTLTNEKGEFGFSKMEMGKVKLTISSIGFKVLDSFIVVHAKEEMRNFYLQTSTLFLEPLEIKSIRAADAAPFTKTNLSQEQIAKNNLGQDLPFLLDQVPGVVIQSDAGTGIGYTGLRIRGSDATRVNITLNGIPYNDAESMGTFFVNLPDFSSSVGSIQIQRGVGTSSNGAGAFGGSINLSTNQFNEKAQLSMNHSLGSFGTLKNNLLYASGLIHQHFTLDARISRIVSNGYIDRAKSHLQSFYTSAAWINNKSSLRLNIFSGKEKTYQAWYGVPDYLLDTQRTINPAGMEKTDAPYENQTDNYLQTHYQFFYNQEMTNRWKFNTALFYTRGKGYYEEYKAAQSFSKYGLPNPIVGGNLITKTDLVRQRWLDNHFLGQIASFQYKNLLQELCFGGGWSQYTGSHFGKIIWVDQGPINPVRKYYLLPAKKTDINLYGKLQQPMGKYWLGFIDLQYRFVEHQMNGFQNNPQLTIERKFHFFNPKLGVSFTKNGWKTYASYAIAQKEPNREDFEAGTQQQPKFETLHNVELGIQKKRENWQFNLNGYWMGYQNQLVLTGQINDVGAYTRINIPKSFRLGIELDGTYAFQPWIQLAANLALSQNKIQSFTEYIDNWDNGTQTAILHQDKQIAFSPNWVAGATLIMQPIKKWELRWIHKYVGKSYLDNTQNESRKLNAFLVQHLQVSHPFKLKKLGDWQLLFQINNLLNLAYEPNGYTYNYYLNNTLNTENSYYPMALRNYLLGINLKL